MEIAISYINYPEALKILDERLNATPEELAAWIFMGPEHGGLAAFTNANEIDPPPRFYYDSHSGEEDYVALLAACWFKAEDIANFQPTERYITGKALIERWGKHPGIRTDAFIKAKIVESCLVDLHPTCGGTNAAASDSSEYPPLEAGLFAMSQVAAVEEANEIIPATQRPTGKESKEVKQQRLAARIVELKNMKVRNFLETVAKEERLSKSRIKQILSNNSSGEKSPFNSWAALATPTRQASQKKSKT